MYFCLCRLTCLLLVFTSFVWGQFRRGQHVDCVYSDVGVFVCDGIKFENSDEEADVPGSWQWWVDFIVCISLLIVAALSFGLTMGLMSLDVLKVRLLKRSKGEGSGLAKVVHPIIKRHHLLLVSLLLAFVASLETIPLFLIKLVPNAYISIGISVPAVLFFGLIIPGSLCTRYALECGYYFSWFVYLMMICLGLVAWPISKLLDVAIGADDRTLFKRPELKDLVHLYTTDVEGGYDESYDEHGYKRGEDDEDEGEEENANPHHHKLGGLGGGDMRLTNDEVAIIIGALNMTEKCVRDAMVPLSEVYMLSDDAIFDHALMEEIVEHAHSRIPVYHGRKELIIGMLLTVQLIKISPKDRVPLEDLEVLQVPRVSTSMSLYKVFNQFKSGKSQMAIVLDEKDFLTPVGIITLEDIFEVLIEDEIYDEHDLRKMNKKKEANTTITLTAASPLSSATTSTTSSLSHITSSAQPIAIASTTTTTTTTTGSAVSSYKSGEKIGLLNMATINNDNSDDGEPTVGSSNSSSAAAALKKRLIMSRQNSKFSDMLPSSLSNMSSQRLNLGSITRPFPTPRERGGGSFALRSAQDIGLSPRGQNQSRSTHSTPNINESINSGNSGSIPIGGRSYDDSNTQPTTTHHGKSPKARSYSGHTSLQGEEDDE